MTDLAITGKPAQFGRGVMQDVSDKLLGQFVSCLETRLAGDAATQPSGESGQESAPAADDRQVAPQAEPTPVSPTPDSPGPVSEVPPEPAQPPSAVAEPAPAAPAAPRKDDAINLGATVLPILIRTYWWAGVIVLALVVLVIWLVAS